MENLTNKNKKIKLWKIICFFSVILFFFVLSLFCFYLNNNKKEILNNSEKKEEEKKEDCVDCARRLLDGVYVKKGLENLYPFAVVIDNHINARPPAGLSEANLVYEAEAEGGITRYLAIFANDNKISEIGPIRSARPYFIDWAREFSALFVHCGGSPEALVNIIKEDIFDLNEFYNSSYFWRENNNRRAPHNVFSSSEKIKEYINIKRKSEAKFFSWEFKDKEILESKEDKNYPDIEIDFKNPDFVVLWKYDIIKNNYERYLSGQKHKTANEDEIESDNIILHFLSAEVLDEKLRLKMDTVGKGEAVICMDGVCREGGWQKNNLNSRTRYYDKENQEIIFNAGKTWIEVLRLNIKFKY